MMKQGNTLFPKKATKRITLNYSGAASEGRGSFDNDGIQKNESETEADLYIKDAILVFRALCKLSKKSIQSEWQVDTEYKRGSWLIDSCIGVTI